MNFDLEKDLRTALRREEPSADFTDRVMACLAAQHQAARVAQVSEQPSLWRVLAGFFRAPQMKWVTAGALACLLLAATFGVARYREQQREIAEGERAKEQVILALQIASAKLNAAQKKIKESGERDLSGKTNSRQ
jgi:negative regulator of sigma E activity